ncbi:MAG TPA: glycosyltransferase family 4 protein [Tepidisphaeraceae bacterium]|nr:glycosyltransferase family 4 protein [Tepidisphaeraceae bacterium]
MPSLGYLVPEFPGQTHIWMWREIVALRNAGVDVKLVSTRRPADDACRHDFAAEARRLTHYLYPPRMTPMLKRIIRTPSIVRYVNSLKESSIKQKLKITGLATCAADLAQWARANDVYHIHCHSAGNAAHVVAMANALSGVNYSITLHGDLEVYGVDHRSKFGKAKFIATAGEHLIEPVVAIGIDRAKVFSNPMGTDTNRFIDAGKRDPQANRLKLLTVARLHRCKGYIYAFEAMRHLLDSGMDIHYSLAGDGPHKAEIIADIERLKLTDRIDVLGSVGETGVIDLMQTHDAFLLTSIGVGEAAPVGVMEAMSTALPVVCSIIGSTAHMIQDGRTGFLTKQEDIDTITRVLTMLGNDVELRKRIGNAAREYAIANFDSKVSALRLLARTK